MKKNQKNLLIPHTPMGIICAIGTLIFLISCGIAIYIMAGNIGQVPGIDFGPGQYYYTDIPGWQKYFLPNPYSNQVPLSILILLFFAWGLLMYRLWTYLDKKLK